MTDVLNSLLNVVIPVVIGIATTPVVDALKRASNWLDAAPAIVKNLVVVAVAGLSTYLAHWLGQAVPDDVLHWDANTVSAILAAVVAAARKRGQQVVALRDGGDSGAA